jgi:ribulose-phosphate 3-epimerase
VLPSILSADMADLRGEIDSLGDIDALHIDVMDGHFVTQLSFGPVIVKAARKVAPDAFLDCHLMVTNPEERAAALVEAGADCLTFHAELADNVRRTLRSLRDDLARPGTRLGVAINPATPAEAVFPILDHVDLVLVMSVVPGRSGQAFMPEVLAKAEAIKRRLGPGQVLEMDGGIGPETARQCRDAGCDWFVAASAIFGEPDRRQAMIRLVEQIG